MYGKIHKEDDDEVDRVYYEEVDTDRGHHRPSNTYNSYSGNVVGGGSRTYTTSWNEDPDAREDRVKQSGSPQRRGRYDAQPDDFDVRASGPSNISYGGYSANQMGNTQSIRGLNDTTVTHGARGSYDQFGRWQAESLNYGGDEDSAEHIDRMAQLHTNIARKSGDGYRYSRK